MKLYIMRHGETFESKNGVEYGDQDFFTEILPEGVPIVKAQAKYISVVKSDAYFRSEYIRAKQTAEIVENLTGKKFSSDKRLNELYVKFFDDAKKRVQEFIKYLNDENYESVTVVTHGGIIAGLTHLATTEGFELIDLYDFPGTSVLTILDGDKVERIDFSKHAIQK